MAEKKVKKVMVESKENGYIFEVSLDHYKMNERFFKLVKKTDATKKEVKKKIVKK